MVDNLSLQSGATRNLVVLESLASPRYVVLIAAFQDVLQQGHPELGWHDYGQCLIFLCEKPGAIGISGENRAAPSISESVGVVPCNADISSGGPRSSSICADPHTPEIPTTGRRRNRTSQKVRGYVDGYLETPFPAPASEHSQQF